MPLPTNIDATYADSPSDASQKAHQQQHDLVGTLLNAICRMPEDPAYGAVGNGISDDATPLTSCANTAAGQGIMVLRPGRTYAISNWDLPSNLIVWGPGAILKAVGTGVNDRVITATDKTNIQIYGVTIDGDKASFATTTEQRHGIAFFGCSKIKLVDVTSKNNKGDGFYFGRGTSAGCSDVEGERIIGDGNHRNAMSVVDLVRANFYFSQLINTTGTAPQDGVDFEPNVSANTITDIHFYKCKLNSNSGDGVGINRLNTGITPTVARIFFDHCDIKNNGLRGVIASYGQGRFFFDDCEVESNGGHAYSFEPTANMADVGVRGGSIRSNLRVGVRTAPAASMTLTRVRVSDVDILDNSTEGAGTWEGISVGSRTTFMTVNDNLIANTVGGVGMDEPYRTADTTVTDFTVTGNRIQTISGAVFADEVASRINANNG